MYRKDLIGLLQDHQASLHELAGLLDMRPRELEADLRHLVRSLKHLPYHAIVSPAVCRKCGFVFSSDRLRKPGRCPRCRGTWISDARIRIEAQR